jgi:hypothetical protein
MPGHQTTNHINDSLSTLTETQMAGAQPKAWELQNTLYLWWPQTQDCFGKAKSAGSAL